jgi:hypothetical protein
VVGYLRARGWQRFSEEAGKFSVWENPAHPDAEVVVPLRREASDFVICLAEILRELEAAEGRSQFDILRDLLNSGFDVMRLGASSTGTSGGTIGLDDGLRMVGEAREMLLSAACATVRPRAVFHARKPQQANEYMKAARLGQTEHGSYVLTILSPVAPRLNVYSETDLFPEEPFERQVVRTLARSVKLAVGAAEQAGTAAQPNFDPFQQVVSAGVSANLCEAIAGFFQIGDPISIDLSVAWAQNRPAPNDTPSRTLITSDVIPTLAEAARVFRARDTLEAYQVRGPVVKLERPDGQSSGHVTILALVEGATRKVVVTLSEADYNQATEAHQNYRSVKVAGDIVREGRSFRLKSPSGFDVVDDEDDHGP